MYRSLFIGVIMLTLTGCDVTPEHAPWVGSRDCQSMVDIPELLDRCETCQGQPCSDQGCELLPCIEGAAVVQGCDDDSQCQEFGEGYYCGMGTSLHSGLCGTDMGDL